MGAWAGVWAAEDRQLAVAANKNNQTRMRILFISTPSVMIIAQIAEKAAV
jgi:hypothetical protein